MKGFSIRQCWYRCFASITSATRQARSYSSDSNPLVAVGAHSLAEVYSTLTRMPGKHRISAEQATLFIGSIRERLSIIALDGARLLWESWAAESMTPCSRTVPSKRMQRRFIAGMAGTTPSVERTWSGHCEHLKKNQESFGRSLTFDGRFSGFWPGRGMPRPYGDSRKPALS
jgi:hypothetical protein